MATKPSFDNLASLANEPDIHTGELLTSGPKKQKSKAQNFDVNEGRKTGDDEIVMVGVRMTKRHRKLLIHMSTELEITMQEVVRRALAAYRESQGLR